MSTFLNRVDSRDRIQELAHRLDKTTVVVDLMGCYRQYTYELITEGCSRMEADQLFFASLHLACYRFLTEEEKHPKRGK